MLGRVVVTEAMHANGAAFHLSCETQAVNCPIDMRPIKILGDGHLPPECSIVLHSSWAVVVFVALYYGALVGQELWDHPRTGFHLGGGRGGHLPPPLEASCPP